MVVEAKKVEKKEEGKEKVEGKEEGKEKGNGKKPIETVNIFTSNGMLSFSVWEGGSISVRVSKRKDNSDEYINVWQGRISPVDFISQFGDLKTVAKTAQNELKKVLGQEI